MPIILLTENQLSVEDMKERIDDIVSIPEIRFCGLIDSSGELVMGRMDEGVMPLMTDKQRRKLFQELAHRVSNRTGFDADFGRVKYSSSRREKIVMMSFPLGTHIILVIAEPSVNIDRLAWDVLNKLGRQWADFDGF